MCIAVFLWQSHRIYPFILLLNRDEYLSRWEQRNPVFVFLILIQVLILCCSIFNHNKLRISLLFFLFFFSFYLLRPTKPLAWWEDGEIVGGRDTVAGGTWLACTKHGRLAFLTNFRELRCIPDAKSRGDLPVRFLHVCLPLIFYSSLSLRKCLTFAFAYWDSFPCTVSFIKILNDLVFTCIFYRFF